MPDLSNELTEQDYMSLWSGQSSRLAKSQTVKSLMESIISEAKKIK